MSITVVYGKFEWDQEKEESNFRTHGIDFRTAARAFADPNRVLAVDENHSETEERLFLFGKVDHRIVTVRFTYRRGRVRIIGAGYWRKGRRFYGQESN